VKIWAGGGTGRAACLLRQRRWFIVRVMGILRVLVALGLFMAGTAAATAGDAGIVGDWSRSDGKSRINIAPCGQQFCAVNTWIKESDDGEAVGDRFVMTLHPQDDKLAGEAFDEKRRRTYTVHIAVDHSQMITHGCLLSGFFCRTMSWSRVR
jgi:uncharacterized protein (DUF2147 family)